MNCCKRKLLISIFIIMLVLIGGCDYFENGYKINLDNVEITDEDLEKPSEFEYPVLQDVEDTPEEEIFFAVDPETDPDEDNYGRCLNGSASGLDFLVYNQSGATISFKDNVLGLEIENLNYDFSAEAEAGSYELEPGQAAILNITPAPGLEGSYEAIIKGAKKGSDISVTGKSNFEIISVN